MLNPNAPITTGNDFTIHVPPLGAPNRLAGAIIGTGDPIRWAGDRLAEALKLNLPSDDDESLPLRIDLDRLLERADRIRKRHGA